MTTTAYCIFKFLDTFFASYEIENLEKLDDLSCVIPMKAVLGVFKSHGHKDKKVSVELFINHCFKSEKHI